MLRNPLRHAVSWAWMCQHGPLSLIGPPCLLSPYRYCVSTTRAFSVPEREGGREGGGRTEEGGGERREERRANVGRTRFLRSLVVDEKQTSVFHYFTIFGFRGKLCEGAGLRVCFYWYVTVNCQTSDAPGHRHCQHNLTVYKQTVQAGRRQQEPFGL